MPRINLSRRRIAGLSVAVAALITGAVVALMPSSGADFTASDTGNVNVSTANLSLSLTDDGGSTGTFNLAYTNLAPGAEQTRAFAVKNTGSIPATVKLGGPITNPSFTVPTGQDPDPAKLQIGVDGYKALTSVTSLGDSIPLGDINAGETKVYTLRVKLASTAGNEWQNVKLGATGTVTLTQKTS